MKISSGFPLRDLLFVWGLLIFSASPALAEAPPEPDWDCRYIVLEGTVGENLELRMFLHVEDRKVEGTYYYLKTRQSLRLRGESLSDGRTVITEESWQHTGKRELPNGGITGTFEGKLTLPEPNQSAGRSESESGEGGSGGQKARFSGTWVSGDQSTRLPFALTERYAPGILEADIFRFKVRWERTRGRQFMVRQHLVAIPQFRGDSPGIVRINAWIRAGVSWPADLSAPDLGEPESEESIFFSLSEAMSQLQPDQAMSLAELEAKLSVDPVPPGALTDSWGTISAASTRNEIVANEGGMVSIRFHHSHFVGGGEAYGDDGFLTFDVNTGNVIPIDQLFRSGFEKPLAEMANRRLAENWGLSPGTSLRAGGANVDAIGLSNDWFLTPDGIGFSFVAYKIAPGPFGDVTFSLPRTLLGELMAEDSPLARAVSR